MRFAKKKHKILSAGLALALAILWMAGFPAVKVYAASGTVYSCTINRCYAHPVSGTIEDSGGESNYTTGQGMVEGCMYSDGILEVTDDGAYYLTIRMSLMDYTSGHDFRVQSVGDTGWSAPSEIGITGNGSDSNGATADVCMRVPSENCIVRCAMYVEPMGRDVIFYFYPSDYSEGNATDMNATMVTESADTAEAADTTTEAAGSTSGQSLTAGSLGGTGTKSSAQATGTVSGESTDTEENEEADSASNEEKTQLSNSITEAAEPETASTATDNAVSAAQGLSLSTAEEETGETASEGSTSSFGSHIFQIALAVTIVGLILIGVTAAVVYFFHRNRKRWGGAEDDDE